MRSNKSFNFPRCVNLIFFYAQSISKGFLRKAFLKNFGQQLRYVFIGFRYFANHFYGFFLDRLKPVKNLAFLKTKRTKKFPLSISVSDWRLSYNVLPVGVGCGHWCEYSQPGQTKAGADAFANLQKKRKQTPAPIRIQTHNQENPSNCANRVL